MTRPRDLAAPFARGLPSTSVSNRGAGKTGYALHPRSRVLSCAIKTHTSIQVQRRHSGLRRAVVYGFYRVLPGDRAFAHVTSEKLSSQELDPSVGGRRRKVRRWQNAGVALLRAVLAPRNATPPTLNCPPVPPRLRSENPCQSKHQQEAGTTHRCSPPSGAHSPTAGA